MRCETFTAVARWTIAAIGHGACCHRISVTVIRFHRPWPTQRALVFQLRGLELDLFLDQLLDVADQACVVACDQRHRQARRTRTPGAADAVHVILGVERHVEVEDRRQVGNVQTARCHVGGHQHIHLAGLESGQRLQPLILALVAMQGLRLQAITLKAACQSRRAQFAVDEHQRLGQLALLQQLPHNAALVVIGDAEKALLDVGGGGVGPGHLHQHGVLQVAVGQPLDLGRERGREQQRLPCLGQVRQDALQVRQEADVQHAVGLVEHHVLDLVEHRVLGLDVVQQPAGCGDQHLDAGFELQRLRLHVDAAENDGRAQIGMLGVLLDVLGHLVGQLSRRRQHQCAHRVAGWAHAGVFMAQHFLQQRQRERGGFAGAGLRRAHHVTASQHDRDGLGLDRRHRGVAAVDDGTQELGIQRQGVEERRWRSVERFGRPHNGGVVCFGHVFRLSARARKLPFGGGNTSHRGDLNRTMRQYKPM